MIIQKLPLKDAALIDPEPFQDERGLFARFFCSRELERIMAEKRIVNVNFSRTLRSGAVRGLHFQRPPHQEMKLVRCIRGAVFDVLVDIRCDSAHYLRWHGEMLTADNMKMLCVPEGFAHGIQALDDKSEVLYLTTNFYSPSAEGGLRYDDPDLGIRWPLVVSDISEKDLSYPLIADREDLSYLIKGRAA
jgi:dTDP-4-dehydrorhamnose 3,5-epimerase